MMRFFSSSGTVVSESLLDLIFDKTLSSRYGTLLAYLKSEKISFDRSEYEDFVDYLENEQLNQIKYLSVLLYYGMSQTGKWGYAGEQAVQNAMIRSLIDVPAEEFLSYEHSMQFQEKIESLYKEYDIHLLSGQQALDDFERYELKFLGRSVIQGSQVYNRLLSFCGSSLTISIGRFQDYRQYIIGEAMRLKRSVFDISIFKKEIFRTPNMIMSCAALNCDEVVELRMDSLKTIFFQKWCQVFNHNFFLQSRIESDPMWDISQFIKERALHCYGVDSEGALKAISKKFLGDIRETVMYHELGHGVMNLEFLDVDVLAFAQVTNEIGTETIYNTLWEFLADFAPEKNGIHGPMWNMVKISETDLSRAESMFWVYFSDIWFYDTEDDYMESYSDVMVLIFLRYIRKDLSIDFEKLRHDLTYDPTNVSVDSDLGVFQKIIAMLISDCQEMMSIIKSAQYNLATTVDFQYVSNHVTESISFQHKSYAKDSIPFKLSYWQWMMGSFLAFSDSKEKLLDYIRSQEKKIIIKLMVASAGRKRAESYGYDHRRYIAERCQALGMVSRLKKER